MMVIYSVATGSALSRQADEPSRPWAGTERDFQLRLKIAQFPFWAAQERLRAARAVLLSQNGSGIFPAFPDLSLCPDKLPGPVEAGSGRFCIKM